MQHIEHTCGYAHMMDKFHERLNESVSESGMSRTEIIDALKLKSRSGIKKWMDGTGKPDAENAVKLALLLGVLPEWLILGTGKKRSNSKSEVNESEVDSYLSAPIGQYLDRIDRKIQESTKIKTVNINDVLQDLPDMPNDEQWRDIVDHYERAGFKVVSNIKW